MRVVGRERRPVALWASAGLGYAQPGLAWPGPYSYAHGPRRSVILPRPLHVFLHSAPFI